MIAVLTDEDFNARIVRGLFRERATIDLMSANAAGLGACSDAILLDWAAAHGRVVLTRDANTMIRAALDRVRIGEAMPGVIAVPQFIAIGAAISDLSLILSCAVPSDLDGQVWYLPL